jgi:putative phage-type endonuclease
MIVQQQQRSPEWHAQRKLRLTGSRIGAILGLSPWQKPDDVLREMVREHHGAESEFTGNPATDWGNRHETQALLCFMRHTDLQVEQCGFFPYGDRMGASPDGLTSDGGVLEIKAPYGLRKGGEFKPLEEQPHYAAQVQMELLATGRKHAYFAQYRAPYGDPLSHDYVPEAMHIERVEHDAGWIDRVLPELDLFYKRLLAELDNPEHLEPLRVSIDTPEAGLLLTELDALRQRQKEDAEREKAIIAELVAQASDKNALVHGRKLTKTKDSKSTAYAKALAELAPGADLSKWESVKKGGWRLS